MPNINPNEVYTTEEARDFLKISESTIKRLLKGGIIQANKIGRQYRIVGYELLRVVSPGSEKKARILYRRLKHKAKREIEKW